MGERVWQLRALSVPEILDETIRLYRHNFLHFLGLVALVQVPVGLLSIGLSLSGFWPMLAGMEGGRHYILAFSLLWTVVGFFVAGNLVAAALAWAVSNRYLGEPVSIAGAYRAIFSRLVPLSKALLLLFLINAILFLLMEFSCLRPFLWIPLIVFVDLRLAFVVHAIILERSTCRQAFSRSWELVQGRAWRVLGVMILLVLFALLFVVGPNLLIAPALGLVPLSPGLMVVATEAASLLLDVLYRPILWVGVTLLYFDLRVRREGLDLALQADALSQGGIQPPSTPAPHDTSE